MSFHLRHARFSGALPARARQSCRSARRAGLAAAGAALVALALVLAGCGATYGASGAPTSTPGLGHPINGTSVRPCVGPLVRASTVGTVAHVLTNTQAGTTVSARQGELIQVQLPMTYRWSFDNQAGNLTAVPPADGQDPTLNVCFWTFRAQSTGSVTLHFTGTPLCDQPSQPCPQFALLESYTISVA